MKVDKIAKGTNRKFASGGKTPMLGKGNRTVTKFPASPQKSGRTAQHAVKPAPKRVKAADPAGDMGGSPGVSNPRRPAA